VHLEFIPQRQIVNKHFYTLILWHTERCVVKNILRNGELDIGLPTMTILCLLCLVCTEISDQKPMNVVHTLHTPQIFSLLSHSYKYLPSMRLPSIILKALLVSSNSITCEPKWELPRFNYSNNTTYRSKRTLLCNIIHSHLIHLS